MSSFKKAIARVTADSLRSVGAFTAVALSPLSAQRFNVLVEYERLHARARAVGVDPVASETYQELHDRVERCVRGEDYTIERVPGYESTVKYSKEDIERASKDPHMPWPPR